MHVLNRSHHLHRALAAAVAAAVLAIVITLAVASGLNDIGSAPRAVGTPVVHAAVKAPAISIPIGNPFTRRSFMSPFTAPPRLPWAPPVR